MNVNGSDSIGKRLKKDPNQRSSLMKTETIREKLRISVDDIKVTVMTFTLRGNSVDLIECLVLLIE